MARTSKVVVEPAIVEVQPFVHERFWDFIKLNGIDQVEIYNHHWGSPSDNTKHYVVGTKWIPRDGAVPPYTAWRDTRRVTLFKTREHMNLEEAMEYILTGVKSDKIVFRCKYPIEVLPTP